MSSTLSLKTSREAGSGAGSSASPVSPSSGGSFSRLGRTLSGVSADSSTSSSGGSGGPGSALGAGSTVPPGGGILNNAKELPTRNKELDANASGSAKVAHALKGMFKHPPRPGSQAKLPPGAGPLGKTFEREQPIPKERVSEIKGPEVLDWDPRGRAASVGDGVLPLTNLKAPPSGEAVGLEQEARKLSIGGEAEGKTDVVPLAPASADAPVPPEGGSLDSLTSGASSRGRAFSSASSAGYSAVTSSSSSAPGGDDEEASSVSGFSANGSTNGSASGSSIRFAPLPTSGRLKRANSITIGVAARSQLLQSQGSGRQNYNNNSGFGASSWQYSSQQPRFGAFPAPPAQNQQQPPQQHRGPNMSGSSPERSWNAAAPPSSSSSSSQRNELPAQNRQEDIIDVGEIMSKGAMKAWRKMRGRSASRDSSASSTSSSAADIPEEREREEIEAAAKSKPPAADAQTSASPKTAASAIRHSLDEEAEGFSTPKRSASPTHMSPHHEDHGARTPLALGGKSTLASEDAMPHITRRLSTGAFLRDQSLRQIQESRRRELLGEGEEPELAESTATTPGAMSGEESGAATPHAPEEQRGWISGLIPQGLANAAGLGGANNNVAGEAARGRSKAGHAVPNGGGKDVEEFRSAVEKLPSSPSDEEESEMGSEASREEEEDEDDEETREAERLADAAMNNHSAKAMKAGGIEKMERKRR